ncbi:uncharacterized protein LOC103167129 [Ornithorhynchus anatinus]|uniref:uncharacterized protein LOC103167129 n=1 Tax=Ornithorhynchus anatinus TaxID=9258 RepID=UPI0010A86967|nr:uncharacterized protein LOC103167129 [Ornithorhynchus anatinus]
MQKADEVPKGGRKGLPALPLPSPVLPPQVHRWDRVVFDTKANEPLTTAPGGTCGGPVDLVLPCQPRDSFSPEHHYQEVVVPARLSRQPATQGIVEGNWLKSYPLLESASPTLQHGVEFFFEERGWFLLPAAWWLKMDGDRSGGIAALRAFLLFLLVLFGFLITQGGGENQTSSSTNLTSASMNLTSSLTNLTSAPTNLTSPQVCHSFRCVGEMCYQEDRFANQSATCSANESYCELYRFSPSNYSARCSGNCESNGTVQCPGSNGTAGQPAPCTLECCPQPFCLKLNASAYGDKLLTTPAPTTSTTPAPRKNGKVCVSFSCQGENCFKGQKTEAACNVGSNFCEMKKTQNGYEAGCSKACKMATPICNQGVKPPCYQECCQPTAAMPSCLKLDGSLNLIGSAAAAQNRLLPQVLAAVALFLVSFLLP